MGQLSSEQAQLHNVQGENQQTEHINVEANCGHHFPTTLNGKIYPKAVKKPELYDQRGPRLANEVLVNNLTLTGNLRMQAPNKSKVVILSDSHLKGCNKRINNYLSDKFRTFGWIKPGALAGEILDRLGELEET
jgi:hypothetical protein